MPLLPVVADGMATTGLSFLNPFAQRIGPTGSDGIAVLRGAKEAISPFILVGRLVTSLQLEVVK
jgi:hypothetical protein